MGIIRGIMLINKNKGIHLILFLMFVASISQALLSTPERMSGLQIYHSLYPIKVLLDLPIVLTLQA